MSIFFPFESFSTDVAAVDPRLSLSLSLSLSLEVDDHAGIAAEEI